MLAFLKHNKILKAIIAPITVDMVNMLSVVQQTAKVLLHYQAMLKDIAISICLRMLRLRNVPIASFMLPTSTFPFMVAGTFNAGSMTSKKETTLGTTIFGLAAWLKNRHLLTAAAGAKSSRLDAMARCAVAEAGPMVPQKITGWEIFMVRFRGDFFATATST